MVGKAKFDQEAAVKSIVGVGREPESENKEMPVVKAKNKDRVQRSYFLDRDIDKALRRMSIDKEKNLTEIVNELLRKGLCDYII